MPRDMCPLYSWRGVLNNAWFQLPVTIGEASTGKEEKEPSTATDTNASGNGEVKIATVEDDSADSDVGDDAAADDDVTKGSSSGRSSIYVAIIPVLLSILVSFF